MWLGVRLCIGYLDVVWLDSYMFFVETQGIKIDQLVEGEGGALNVACTILRESVAYKIYIWDG